MAPSSASPTESPSAKTYVLRVDGMTCGHCSATLTKALSALPGIVSADANHASGTAEVRYTGPLDLPKWGKVVASVGYKLIDDTDTERPAARERRRARLELVRLAWSFAWTLPVLIIHYGGFIDHASHAGSTHWSAWVVFVCAAVLQPTSAITYYQGAFRALRRGAADMDVLVSAGVFSGFVYATLSTFLPAHFPGDSMEFFEAATLLICFIRLGKWMEAHSRANAAEAMSDLLDLTPRRVTLIDPDGNERSVDAATLQVGDRFSALPGDVLAVDGTIIEGDTLVDEAVITGESRPISKARGEIVVAGSSNLRSRIVVRATRVGSDTTVARIVSMVEKAQTEKAPIQRMADRIAAIFVPVVVIIAIASGIGWAIAGKDAARVLTHVIGVLVIACPCALGLAVPAAIMIGSAAGMRKGVLVRSGAALEALDGITLMVFDKTGTLTEGRPRVTSCKTLAHFSETDVARALLAASRASGHPASSAAAAWAKSLLPSETIPPLGDGTEVPGMGVEYQVGNTSVRLGRQVFVSPDQQGGGVTPPSSDSAASTLWVAINGTLAAILEYSDPIRPEAAAVIADLKRRNVKTVLLSGDRPGPVESVAHHVGVAEHQSGATPESKLARIREWQSKGERVGMVGDGVNDAPALAQADLGIVMGSGAGISQQAGSIVLTGGLSGLTRAVELSRRVRRGIRGNLAASLIYNIIGIPLAAGVAAIWWDGAVIPASFAALAMVMSDASVALNSWLLSRRLRNV